MENVAVIHAKKVINSLAIMGRTSVPFSWVDTSTERGNGVNVREKFVDADRNWNTYKHCGRLRHSLTRTWRQVGANESRFYPDFAGL